VKLISLGTLYIHVVWFIYSRDDFLNLFNLIQLISSENCFLKVAGHGQSRAKMTVLKGGVDGFSYFTLISVILFCNHDYP
jgi:hypothetical protein